MISPVEISLINRGENCLEGDRSASPYPAHADEPSTKSNLTRARSPSTVRSGDAGADVRTWFAKGDSWGLTRMTANIRLRPIVEDDREHLHRCYANTRTGELSVVDWSDERKEEFLRMQFHAQSVHYGKHYPTAQFQIILVDERPV
jgi:hypothetical protein